MGNLLIKAVPLRMMTQVGGAMTCIKSTQVLSVLSYISRLRFICSFIWIWAIKRLLTIKWARLWASMQMFSAKGELPTHVRTYSHVDQTLSVSLTRQPALCPKLHYHVGRLWCLAQQVMQWPVTEECPTRLVKGPFSFSPHTDSQSASQKMAEAGSLKERSSAFMFKHLCDCIMTKRRRQWNSNL